MDSTRAEALNVRIFTEMSCALGLLNVFIGHRLGLFKELARSGPVTASELAGRTNLSERYVLEWLMAVATSDYVDADESGESFALSEEHAKVLAHEDSSFFMGAFPGVLQGSALVTDALTEAFRSGGGVQYEDYGEHFRCGVALTNRPMFQHDYAQKWIPAMPGIEAKLHTGARVVDVGSGLGWSSVFLARHFENVTVDGVDPEQGSVDEAGRLAAREGVADRVRFHASTIENFNVRNPYDLVTAFECLHDLPYPVQALQRMREIVSANGRVFIADEAGGENFSNNRSTLGRFFYNVSVLHCLPQAMVFPEAAGTGTAISETTVRNYALEAGYSGVSVLDIENPFFRFYEFRP